MKAKTQSRNSGLLTARRRSYPDNAEKGNWQNKFKQAIKTQSGLSHVMYIILEEENNNSYLVGALHTALTPVPSKSPPIPPPPIPTPLPPIAADAVVTLSATFLDLSTKGQLNSILNHK